MTDATLAGVQKLVAPIAAELKLDLEAIEIKKTGNRRIIKVILDKDGGISLEDVAAATREISTALDDFSALDSPFTLEVTSPGVDRPLTEPRHWKRNIGRLVKIESVLGENIEGRIIEVSDDQALLQIKQLQRWHKFDQIKRAVVQVEFNRPSEVSDGH